MLCLKDKFRKTKAEKLKTVLMDMLNFTAEDEETDEEYWDKFQKLLNDIKRENVHDHLNYLMCIMMLEKANRKRKVSEEEIVQMREVLEEGKEKCERIPRKDDEVGMNLKV
jgi:hypothetical protein